MACAFAQALDLAEGKPAGHAARVCYIALNLAEGIELSQEQRQAVFYGALLHEAGAAPASAELCRILDLGEEAIFGARAGLSSEEIALKVAPFNAEGVVAALRAHTKEGARVAAALGFDAAVQEAIASHHEHWDGSGYPKELAGDQIPITGRVIAAADLIDALISTGLNPLVARRNLVSGLTDHAGTSVDPDLAREAHGLIRSDAFWLGIHSSALPRELAMSLPGAEDEERSPADVHTFATVFSGLGDAKGEHTERHSERTAEIADQLAEALGFTEGRREMVRIAATARDVGLLGVPARVIAKPDILSLSEMEAMRKHPTYSQQVMEALPGMEEIAGWVGAHHERPDGKGYPEMLEEGTVAIEARIIAVADTYVALTSSRPYRKALSDEDAMQVLQGGAGTQLDPKLVKLFCSRPARATSSRTARRSRQKR